MGDGLVAESALVDLEFSSQEDLIASLPSSPEVVLTGLMNSTSSRDFLAWIAKYLQKTLDIDFAFVGALGTGNFDQIETLRVCRRGQMVENFSYDLKGTPCSDVMGRDVCYCLSGLAVAYPEDKMLIDMKLDSYIGISLLSNTGTPLGIAVLLDGQPISQEKARAAGALLRVLRPRLVDALTHRQSLLIMASVASEPVTSQSTIEHLVLAMAETTRIKSVFVSTHNDGSKRIASTLALVVDGNLVPNSDYELAETPCEQVAQGENVAISEGLRTIYPGNPFLENLHAEAYFGIPVYNGDGRACGHICVIHDRPVETNILEHELFRVLATRLSAELRRNQLEKERAELELRLADAQRHESIGTLASGVAHDFNNLLFVIGGQTQVLLRSTQGDENLTQQLGTIVEATSQAEQLCQQLLTYSSRKSSPESRIDLNDVVVQCQRIARVFASGKADILYTLHGSPLTVLGSLTRLQQAVMNLLKNASDAIEERGTIRVSTGIHNRGPRDFDKAVVGSHCGAGRYAALTVSDNGCGMSSEQLRKIVEPYFTTKASGHGLGLSVVVSSVQENNGALEIASVPGGGSRFTIFLPLLEETERDTTGKEGAICASPASEERDTASRRVLVIDDDPLVRETLKSMLQSVDFEPMIASGGREGVEMYRERHHEIDCVIVDYMMPEMRGDDVLVALREIADDVPVLMASGNLDAETALRMVAPPDGFVSKPVSLEALLSKIEELADRGGMASHKSSGIPKGR